jgi:hypothetical protein
VAIGGVSANALLSSRNVVEREDGNVSNNARPSPGLGGCNIGHLVLETQTWKVSRMLSPPIVLGIFCAQIVGQINVSQQNKQSSCNGTTALATWASLNSSSSHSAAKIPKKLTKVKPPKCAGCLFGVMAKLSWCGKETKASHKVFGATKPGECVLVDQMRSTEVGFYAQLKGKLTKKGYKCTTIFTNHHS